MSSPNPILYLARRAWRSAEGCRGRIIVYLVLFQLAMGTSLLEPWVIGRLLDAIQLHASGPALAGEVTRWALVYLGLQLTFWIFHGPARVLEMMVAFDVRARFKGDMIDHVLHLPMAWQREHHSGDTIDRIGQASRALGDAIQTGFENIYMVLRLVGALTLLTFFLPAAGAFALGTTAFCLFMVSRFDRVLVKLYEESNRFENRTAATVHDYLTNVVTVITLRLKERVQRRIEARLVEPRPLERRTNGLNEIKWFSMYMVVGTMIATTLIGHAWSEVAAGRALLAGTLFTLFEYLRRIGQCFYEFGYLYGDLVERATALRSAEAIEAATAAWPVAVGAAEEPWSLLSIRDLTFQYPDAPGRLHLDRVRLDLERGKTVALVGASGSGKSTLLKLLRGLDAPTSALVYRDGRHVSQGLASLAVFTTLLPQDPEIFNDTVRFNVGFGLEESDEEIRKVLDAACFLPVLERLPKGLETDLAEKGVNLSGGEKQRLAIARGLYFARESSLILLDEPTSSVDSHNERRIYARLLAVDPGRCLVSAIHRLHLLPLFDQVVVLEEGRVVQVGPFHDLVSRAGPLQVLWRQYQAELPGAERHEAPAAAPALAAVG